MRFFSGIRPGMPPDETSDAITGDEVDLFAKLVEANREKLYRVAFRMAGDADDAQDLLQDALIEAYRSFKRFREGTYFDKWLYRIMTNTFIDRQRRKKRVGTVYSLDAPMGDEDAGQRDVADESRDPQVSMMRDELSEPLQAALNQLAPDFRMVLILADVEEFSYEEISSMLGVPVGTVRSRLHRARGGVRNHLLKHKI